MARGRTYPHLRVLLNNRPVGLLRRTPGGAVEFCYEERWLAWDVAIPVSLSMPLREESYRGEAVSAVFENLLPDSEPLRRRVAERVGARGTDAYSMLSKIGRDCVGALQFFPEDEAVDTDTTRIEGEPVTGREIEAMLQNLAQAPLGLDRDRDFRISVAGAQEKTALLFHEGRWWRPRGTTPTTHILKKAMGKLQNGIDMSRSVENEFYCLRVLAACGLPVNEARMQTFGKTPALVVTRFDRHWTADGRLLRLPQEDMCQALSFPPTMKYQSEGGPGMADILKLLKASNTPERDIRLFLKAQVLFWLLGATDGHAKNFSIFLGRGGQFQLTPFYDVLSAQPARDAGQILKKEMKLAMAVGRQHYVMGYIEGRHFVQTAEKAGVPASLARDVLDEVAAGAGNAREAVEGELPRGFPGDIHDSVQRGMQERLRKI